MGLDGVGRSGMGKSGVGGWGMGRNWMEPGGQWDEKENPLPYVVELREGEWTEGSGQAGGGAYLATDELVVCIYRLPHPCIRTCRTPS